MARIQGKTEPDSRFCAVGVDVSKAHLDLAWKDGRKLRIPNSMQGFEAAIPDLSDASMIVMEHTGPYHRAAWTAFEAAGLPVAVLDAARVRHMAIGLGFQAKTDHLDAAMLAEIGEMISPAPTPLPGLDQQRLKDLSAARIAMVRRRSAAKAQLKSANDPTIRDIIVEEIEGFDQRIKRLDTEISDTVASSSELAHRSRILCSIPGIGEVAAASILAWLPELGTLSAGQIGALSGTAPLDRSSGQYVGRATPRGGRRQIRQLLHMPSLSAMQFNPDFRQFRERLEARGKPVRLIRTAIMRKLLILANTLVAQDRLWSPTSPCQQH